jgi:iron(III) transport system substrate-binding protein
MGALSAGWKTGMGRLLLMAANARYFTASATQVPNDVGRADAAAGLTIDFYGRVYQEVVGPNRCKFISPVGATSITPDPVGILRGVKGERKELANRFVEFLLTPEAQRLWNLKAGEPGGPKDRSLRRLPIRRDVYADRTGWADDLDPFELAHGFNQRNEWMVLFSDTRPIWVSAWIDSRDALKAAHRKILAVRDETRKAYLLQQLADLPVTMSDVATIKATREKIEASHGDIELWKAQQRIDWGTKFREHYQKIGAQAGSDLAMVGRQQ